MHKTELRGAGTFGSVSTETLQRADITVDPLQELFSSTVSHNLLENCSWSCFPELCQTHPQFLSLAYLFFLTLSHREQARHGEEAVGPLAPSAWACGR